MKVVVVERGSVLVVAVCSIHREHRRAHFFVRQGCPRDKPIGERKKIQTASKHKELEWTKTKLWMHHKG